MYAVRIVRSPGHAFDSWLADIDGSVRTWETRKAALEAARSFTEAEAFEAAKHGRSALTQFVVSEVE